MILAHLLTQDGQPYGSVRKCCERCGLAIPEINPSTRDDIWYDNVKDYYSSELNCSKNKRYSEID